MSEQLYRIKPLVWEELESGSWKACTAMEDYYIHQTKVWKDWSGFFVTPIGTNEQFPGCVGDLESVKEAANKHYTDTIRFRFLEPVEDA